MGRLSPGGVTVFPRPTHDNTLTPGFQGPRTSSGVHSSTSAAENVRRSTLSPLTAISRVWPAVRGRTLTARAESGGGAGQPFSGGR